MIILNLMARARPLEFSPRKNVHFNNLLYSGAGLQLQEVLTYNSTVELVFNYRKY